MKEVKIRQSFPALNDSQIYFNTASFGLQPSPVTEAALALTRAYGSEGFDYEACTKKVEATRLQVKKHLGAPSSVLSFIPGFTYGLQSVIGALPGNKRVLIVENDYPSLFFFWEKSGHDLQIFSMEDTIELDYDKYFAALLDQKIGVAAISHVNNISGLKVDLKRIHDFCAQHNIILITDATQTFGCTQYDLSAYTNLILIASGFKWSCAGHGIGILWMSRALFEQLNMDSEKYSCSMPDTLFELSRYNYESIFRLSAALEFMGTTGIATIEKRVGDLTDYFYNHPHFSKIVVRTLEVQNQSSIISIEDDGSLYQFLKTKNIITSKKVKAVRVSLHYFNTKTEIDRFFACLAEFK